MTFKYLCDLCTEKANYYNMLESDDLSYEARMKLMQINLDRLLTIEIHDAKSKEERSYIKGSMEFNSRTLKLVDRINSSYDKVAMILQPIPTIFKASPDHANLIQLMLYDPVWGRPGTDAEGLFTQVRDTLQTF